MFDAEVAQFYCAQCGFRYRVDPLTDAQLMHWAENRADDAGQLARELVPLRKYVRRLEAAITRANGELTAVGLPTPMGRV